MATVLLPALTLAVGGILGSWFVSMSKSEAENVEERMGELINCTGALDVSTVGCNGTTGELKVAVHNMASDINLYDFSTVALLNQKPYSNSTGGPNSSSPLEPGQQYVLTYGCGTTMCHINASINKVVVSSKICPLAKFEYGTEVTCVK